MKCVLCNSSKTTLRHTLNGYQYHLCAYCNSLSLGNAPTEKDLNEYYENAFSYSYENEVKNKIVAEANKSLDQLLKMNRTAKSLLDIGVGNGEFIETAAKLGLSCKGIEPSRKLYSCLGKNTKKIVINTDIRNFLKDDVSKYDIISLVHVVEHLIDPRGLINELWIRLNKGGILFIETPNINGWLYKVEGTNYTFLTPPDHICLFSLRSLEYIAKNLPSSNKLTINTYSYDTHIIGTIRGIWHYKTQEKFNAQRVTSMNGVDQSISAKSFRRFLGILLLKIIRPLYNLGGHGGILKGYITKT